jgi:hypothetical protein
MEIFLTLILVFFVLAGITWLGLWLKPRPFGLPELPQTEVESIPLPSGLPEPVERFYRAMYGEHIPNPQAAVFSGRGRMRPFGVWMPMRFIFIHRAGKDYRHYFEVTFFGIPVLKVNEGYVDGKSFFESPMGTYRDDANTNQGANLALWAEAGWFPAIWITDPRVRWEGVDEHTALLRVPFDEQSEVFVVRFSPASGLVDTMEAMRYREPGEGKPKILWITRNEREGDAPGNISSTTGSATWLDQGKPWAYFTLEEVAWNIDVQEYIYKRGR